jgi:energy-coupling factor transport system permease protein
MHRALHPLAWWAWAAALAVATTRTSDVRGTALLLGAVVAVVLACRDASPWARSFEAYLALGACIVAIRVVFHIAVGTKAPGTVVLDLPQLTLPDWAVGVQLLGPVTSAGLASAASEGLRLAVLVVCFGAANALANPRRALRTLPASLHHFGSAVVIAVSVTPQLATAAAGVRRAQRLRGAVPRGLRSLRTTALPVLTDALDRSLALAASMDSRGYARTLPGRSDRRVSALLLVALVAAAVGAYGLLAGQSIAPAVAVLAVGTAAATGASVLAGRQVRRSRYRPDPWGRTETAVAAAGVGAASLLLAPAMVGGVPVLALAGALVAALPAVAGPAVLRSGTAPTGSLT